MEILIKFYLGNEGVYIIVLQNNFQLAFTFSQVCLPDTIIFLFSLSQCPSIFSSLYPVDVIDPILLTTLLTYFLFHLAMPLSSVQFSGSTVLRILHLKKVNGIIYSASCFIKNSPYYVFCTNGIPLYSLRQKNHENNTSGFL